MFTLGGAKLGVDLLGGAVESVRINDKNSRQGLSGTSFLRFAQDSCLLNFPSVDDIGINAREPIQENALTDGLSGSRNQANFGTYDAVRLEAADLSLEEFQDSLETWYGSAKLGQDFAYGFDDTDKVAVAVKTAILKGSTYLELMDTTGIQAGRRYLMRRDVLGLFATKNLAPNGGFNSGVASVNTLSGGVINITQDTSVFTEGTGSCKVVTDGGAVGQGITQDIPTPSRIGFFVFSVKVRATVTMGIRFRWVEDGIMILSNILFFTVSGIFDPVNIRVRIPFKTITEIRADVFVSGTAATTFWVDEFQVEQNEFPTPFADSGLTTFSDSSPYAEEYVMVREVVSPNFIILRDPIKFAYNPRDVFKSKWYWPRLTLVDPRAAPFSRKVLTVDLSAQCREVPA